MVEQHHTPSKTKKIEVATLGGGCFWCTEAIFSEIEGILEVEPGYSGGQLETPTYEKVCTGTTGHAEVVRIVFDSEVISFQEILEIFFAMHDPTTLNRQGADVGSQYRSVVFYHSPNQKVAAEKLIKKYNQENKHGSPIVTQVMPFQSFHEAEKYHKEYYRQNLGKPYCRLIISPKIKKIREHYSDKIKNRRKLYNKRKK